MMMNSRRLRDLQATVAVAERFHGRAHAIEHRHVKVAEWSVLRASDVAARVELPAGAAGQNDREIVGIVPIAVGKARSEQNHRVIHQRAIAFTDGTKLIQKVSQLLGVPAVDLRVRLVLFGLILVMAALVMTARYAGNQRREILR